MWFKNLKVYRLTRNIDLSAETLEARLAERRFQSCSNLDFSRYGWVPPLGRLSELYTHGANGCTLICARRQEKILPAAAVNEMVEEKVLALEERQGRNIYRKEKRSLKDEVIHSLLPRALTRSSLTYAYFSPRQEYLFIDAASAAKAEELLDHLRQTVGELPIVPLSCHGDPAEVMTRWLKQSPPKGLEPDGECELQNPLESSNTVRCRHQELESDEIMTHLKAGKRVIQLALIWNNAIRFVLTGDFGIKRLKFEASVLEEAQTEAADAAAQFDQDFAVMNLQLGRLVEDLLEAFGGVEKDR